jgi:hypothetical protein
VAISASFSPTHGHRSRPFLDGQLRVSERSLAAKRPDSERPEGHAVRCYRQRWA